MRSKAPLSLMEQMIMILVFSLAAAICLRAFVESDKISRFCEMRDQAVTVAQSAAETICHSRDSYENAFPFAAEKLGGRCTNDLMWIEYDENWEAVQKGIYRLEAQSLPSDIPGLQKASIRVTCPDNADKATLFALDIAWQEVSGRE